MKYLTILMLLFISLSQTLCSQKIVSKLEIEWQNKQLFLSGFCGNYQVPFLVIKYTNTSNDSLYFYNGLDEFQNKYHSLIYELKLLNYGSYRPICDSVAVHNSEFRETGSEYNVFIGNIPKANRRGWLITDKQTVQAPRGYELPEPHILYKLNKVARRLNNQEVYLSEKDSTWQLCDFCYPDKQYVSDTVLYSTPEEVLSRLPKIDIIYEINQNFICIPPHSTYSKKYDLTHFKIVGGMYNFIHNSIQCKNYAEFSDDYIFPNKYKGYKLYTGKINGAKVKVVIE